MPRRLADVYGQVIFVTLLFFLTFISRFIFSPLMPTIGADLDLSSGQAGTIFFLGSVGVLVGSLFSGVLSSRINHRGNLIVAVLVSAAALMVCYVAQSVWTIQIVVIVLGFCAGLNQPSVTATVAAMVSREDWGKALSVQQTGPRLSYAVAPLLAVGLLTFLSWQAALAVLGVFTALCGIAFIIWGDCGGFKGTPPNPRLLAVIFRERSFWLMILLFSLGIGAQAGLYSMMPLYLTTEQGFSPTAANAIVGLAAIAPIFTTFFAGWLTDKVGEKRAVISFMLVSGAAAVAVGSLSGNAVVAAIFVLSAASGCFFPPAYAALSRIVQPNFRNLAAGLAPPTAFLLGGGLLPIALGYMGEAYSIGLGITITGIAVMAGSFVVLAVRLLDNLEEGC
jgi:NNP family nitrate/nitrite transporter-like MFS transporter